MKANVFTYRNHTYIEKLLVAILWESRGKPPQFGQAIPLSVPKSLQTVGHCAAFDTRDSAFIRPALGRSLACRDPRANRTKEGRFSRGKSQGKRGETLDRASIPFLMAQIRRKGRRNKSERNGWNHGTSGRPVPFILAEGYTPLACSKPLQPSGSFA